MKNKYIKLIVVILLGIQSARGQNNLIPNNGFQDCNTGYTPDCAYNPSLLNPNLGADKFDAAMIWWKVARYTPGKLWCPIWIGDATCRSSQIHCSNAAYVNYPSSRFISLSAQIYPGWFTDHKRHPAIRTSLLSTLQPGTTYVIRMKVLPSKATSGVTSPNSHLRVFFSKWADHWNAGSGSNQLWEAVDANIVLPVETSNCEFQLIERRITIPSGMNALQNIILYQEDARMSIDDVELFEECPSQITIQNQFYEHIAYGPDACEGSHFAEHADDYIDAGNFGNGPVTVEGTASVDPNLNARVTYTAGQKITLSPGFSAQRNSYFNAVITSCPNNVRSINVSTLEDVTNYNYPDPPVERDTVYCPTDSAHIIFIYDTDSLGTIYNYYWDFGNGQTSTQAHPSVYFGTTGVYNASLIVTGSNGFADTLFQQIIVMPCNNAKRNKDLPVTDSGNDPYSMTVYPNPNEGTFTLTLSGDGIRDVFVYDVLGKEVFVKRKTHETNFSINVSTFPKGIYMIKVIGATSIQTQKVITQ